MDWRFLIYFKRGSKKARQVSENVETWLGSRGYVARILEAGQESSEDSVNFNFVIVPGGDGTIIEILKKFAGAKIPVFGINLGRVGFLASAEPDNWESRLEKAMEGILPLQKCLALNWSVFNCGKIKSQGIAVNEVVICRYYPARLMEIEIRICDMSLGILRSDGLIVTTPLGSTGYSISAGGPILYPDMEIFGITPICAFTPGVKPMVVPGSFCLELCVSHSSAECYLTVDGHEALKLEKGDCIHITGWPEALTYFGDYKQFFGHLAGRGLVFELESQAALQNRRDK